jgi:predicted peroxiredoxin
MPETSRDLVVVVTHGIDHELSSVAFTIANRGITAGLRVSVFLTSAGVDLVRKRAADSTQVNPLEPLAAMIKDFLARGGALWACTPCVKSRGYRKEDLIDGVVITGASKMHELIAQGAADAGKGNSYAARERRLGSRSSARIRLRTPNKKTAAAKPVKAAPMPSATTNEPVASST